jgi:hypothetical protein
MDILKFSTGFWIIPKDSSIPKKRENHYDLLDALHSGDFLEVPNCSKIMKFGMGVPE